MNCLYTGNGTFISLVKMAEGVEYQIFGCSTQDIENYWENYLLTYGYK